MTFASKLDNYLKRFNRPEYTYLPLQCDIEKCGDDIATISDNNG